MGRRGGRSCPPRRGTQPSRDSPRRPGHLDRLSKRRLPDFRHTSKDRRPARADPDGSLETSAPRALLTRRNPPMIRRMLRAGPRRLPAFAAGALVAAMVVPTVAGAAGPSLSETASAVNTTWVMVAAILVMFMQAGFLLLEIGFSRMKNAGAGVAKVLMNFSIASLAYWAVGFAFAFGGSGWFAGNHAFFLNVGHTASAASGAIPFLGTYDISPGAMWFFEFVFCAVSLAIVWGTTLERIKWQAYAIYAVVFASVIYPIVSHWIFGGGWLAAKTGMQDFAGSTVVHLIGATGALAALLLLGPRRGKYGPDGKPRAIPGHSMPLVGLSVFILWFGWFGFNPGSGLGAI